MPRAYQAGVLLDQAHSSDDQRALTNYLVIHLPLIMNSDQDRLWYKGVGKGLDVAGHAYEDLYDLGINWWYDWQHEYPWSDPGALDDSRFRPMVWCPDLPGEAGVPYARNANGQGHWNPTELATKVAQHPGRTWLIFNEPDFPPSKQGADMTFDQCGKTLCLTANYATLPALATLPANTTPTPTSTFTPTPTTHPQFTATPTATPVNPCSWPAASPTPPYYNALTSKMIRIAGDRYAQLYRLITDVDPTAKVFCCGNFFAENTQWWQGFLDYLTAYHSDVKIDGVAMHAYPWSKSTDECKLWPNALTIWSDCMEGALRQFRDLHEIELEQPGTPLSPNAPIWITEIGYLVSPLATPTLTYEEVRDYLMTPMIGWLQDGDTGFEAVAWYVTLDTSTYTSVSTNLFVQPTPSVFVLTTPGSTWASATPRVITPTP